MNQPGRLVYRTILGAAIAVTSIAQNNAIVTAQDAVQFNRDVRPILSAACFRCHGSDANKREANLRLDDERSAKSAVDSGATAIVESQLEQSELWSRVNASDPSSVMPPPNANRQLTDAEKETLRRWIEQGAKYQQHWAFEPIVNPAVPELRIPQVVPASPDQAPPSETASVEQPSAELPQTQTPPAETPQAIQQENSPSAGMVEAWSQSPIDRFLFVEIAKRGLQPQSPADRSTLIRRVAFTLTGLPPTPTEVAMFVSDTNPSAYEAMVDRYLASSAFGEEMARHWLDVARYGDTHGLHLDNDRQMWAYRDWVVTAFNRNMPFDQFTIEQLAGDLLPNPTTEQLVATGFNRCNVTTSEGGAIDDEFLFRYAVDRTSTTIQTWLGLTGGCAVCHDHKYDPLSMRDFYSMYSFFYNNADPAMDGNTSTTAPFIRLPSPEQARQQADLAKLIDATRQSLWETAGQHVATLEANNTLLHVALDRSEFVEVLLDDEFRVGTSTRNTSRNGSIWTAPGEMQVPSGRRALKQIFGDRFEQFIGLGTQPSVIPNDANLSFWVQLDRFEPSESIYLEIRTDKGNRRWSWADNPEAAARLGSNPNTIVGSRPTPGQWTRLELDSSAIGFPAGSELLEIKLGHFGGISYWDSIKLNGSSSAESDARFNLDAWWHTRKDKDTPLADAEVNQALRAGPEAEQAAMMRSKVAQFYFAFVAPRVSIELAQKRQDWTDARVALVSLEDQIPGTFVFKDRSEPRQAYVMKRGQYDQKGDTVEPAMPGFLPKASNGNDAKRLNRLDLAQWLLNAENPLPARVTVNRFWQQVFGVGLVKTSDDFGNQGSPPSHPELMDWLAYRFRSEGWNVKSLMKDMVMSQAFRQSPVMTPDHLAKDPENRLLARGPRIRLDAEQLRDNALAVSGLLDSTMGGPGVKPYQPPNIWEPVGYGDSNTRYYVQDHGTALYRRSLYCYIKRTAPPPFMSNFDAPNREQFCARRERSNTPLQALQLMNDVQYIEAARKMAERMLREGGDTAADQLRFGFRLVMARTPDARESEWLAQVHRRFRERYRESPTDASLLLAVGELNVNPALDPVELAAMTLVANLILNLDETITRN